MTLKLKQHLAIEYSALTKSKNLEITEAYIAGFDKAQGMAMQLAQDHYKEWVKCLKGSSYVLPGPDGGFPLFMQQIKNIGEQEIEAQTDSKIND